MLINYKSFNFNADKKDFSISFASLLMVNNDATTVEGYIGGELVFSVAGNSALELQNVLPPLTSKSNFVNRNILTLQCSGANNNFQIYNYGFGY